MKRFIVSVFAATAVMTAVAVNLLDYRMTSGGTPFSDVYPRTIKSVYCLNPGWNYGVTESISLFHKITTKYERQYDWFSPFGGVQTLITNEMSCVYNFRYLSATFVSKAGVVRRDVDSRDPNKWVGVFSGHLWRASDNLELQDSADLRVFMSSHTDVDTYKLVVDVTITNMTGEGYAYFPYETETNHFAYISKHVEYDLPCLFPLTAELVVGTDHKLIFSDKEDASTQMIFMAKRTREYKNTKTEIILSLADIDRSYVITNGVDFIVPANMELFCTTTNSQTAVGIIYE